MILVFFRVMAELPMASAQPVLFDFDNAPIHTSLPVNQIVSGVTAHFSATGSGYSIREANVSGFVPQGFAGNIIYPNSIYLSDLLISFDQTLTDFSIMYSCQELGCDDAATMRVTAYMNGIYTGTNTKTASTPGTWPVDKLQCSFPQGFDSVVVHYDSRPPTCQDYGVIFMADNIEVSALNATSILKQKILIEDIFISDPASRFATISFYIYQPETLKVAVYDITGRLVRNLSDGPFDRGEHQIT